MTLAVEIAVQDLAGVQVALDAGADRVELCAALEAGGLTPSAALIEQSAALAADAGRPHFVHVLIRPRPGDFVYAAEEAAVMRRDVQFAAASGAGGVVIGALTAEGAVDRATTAALIDAAGGTHVTFHRAVDVPADPAAVLDWLAGAGAGRILTSGGAARVGEGIARIAGFAEQFPALEVMAGGGLVEADVAALAGTAVAAVHLSARRVVRGLPSGPGGGPAEHSVTDADAVRRVVAAARAHSQARVGSDSGVESSG